MSESLPDVIILERHIEPAVLRRLVERFEDMVKYVVDVQRGVIAIGRELQSDAEQVLLESGSRQADLWGANPHAHAVAFRALLQLHPGTWSQVPYVTGAAR